MARTSPYKPVQRREERKRDIKPAKSQPSPARKKAEAAFSKMVGKVGEFGRELGNAPKNVLTKAIPAALKSNAEGNKKLESNTQEFFASRGVDAKKAKTLAKINTGLVHSAGMMDFSSGAKISKDVAMQAQYLSEKSDAIWKELGVKSGGTLWKNPSTAEKYVALVKKSIPKDFKWNSEMFGIFEDANAHSLNQALEIILGKPSGGYGAVTGGWEVLRRVVK